MILNPELALMTVSTMVAPAVKKIFLLLSMLFPACVFSQNGQVLQDTLLRLSGSQALIRAIGSRIPVPVISYEPVEPPKYWTKGMLTELGFSQVSLTNWAAGGSGSIAMNAYLNMHINYAKGNMYWENRGQFAYGFIQSFKDGYRKSDDKVILDSKFGYNAFDKFYFSAIYNFKSQFSPGFEYPSSGPRRISQFLAPAYTSLGLGLDYKPGKGNVFSVNFSPVTASLVIVTVESLREKYGNEADEPVRLELGAQLKGDFKMEVFKNCKVNSTLTLFSDYLNQPQNIQINWDLQADFKVNKFLSAGLRTNLVYDNNVLIADKAGNQAPRVQFKEVFSLNFSYTFGNFKK